MECPYWDLAMSMVHLKQADPSGPSGPSDWILGPCPMLAEDKPSYSCRMGICVSIS